jgi:hypothetical protein
MNVQKGNAQMSDRPDEWAKEWANDGESSARTILCMSDGEHERIGRINKQREHEWGGREGVAK